MSCAVIDQLAHSFDPILLQAQVHRATHGTREVQCCTLLSIKTGGCSEDCKYCAQSSRYETSVEPEKFMPEDAVLEAARRVRLLSWSQHCPDVMSWLKHLRRYTCRCRCDLGNGWEGEIAQVLPNNRFKFRIQASDFAADLHAILIHSPSRTLLCLS